MSKRRLTSRFWTCVLSEIQLVIMTYYISNIVLKIINYVFNNIMTTTYPALSCHDYKFTIILIMQDQFSESYNAPLHPIENHFWRSPENLGEISGVAVEPTGNVIIFHRGDRIWNYE